MGFPYAFARLLLDLARPLSAPLARARADDSGQAITEYILLLALTFSMTILVMRAAVKTLSAIVLTFGGFLEKDLKTGRAPLGIWKN